MLLFLIALVVRDILRPEHDVVRRSGMDDPAGGILDGLVEDDDLPTEPDDERTGWSVATWSTPRPAPSDRTALSLWWLSRVTVVLVTVVSAHVLHDTVDGGWQAMVARWQHWDADYYVRIARDGYRATLRQQPEASAFFPGEPVALRLVHLVLRSWTLSALVVSAVAGSVAVAALARLASYETGGSGGLLAERTVLYFVLSPFAVFLAAGYSESLFLAFALTAWLAARQGHWRLAGVLGMLSATVRITGLFLGIALLVDHLVVRHRAGERLLDRESWWLLGPFLGIAAYFGYLDYLTGDALAWVHAQAAAPWTRHLTAPWHALRVTYRRGPRPEPAGAVRLGLRAGDRRRSSGSGVDRGPSRAAAVGGDGLRGPAGAGVRAVQLLPVGRPRHPAVVAVVAAARGRLGPAALGAQGLPGGRTRVDGDVRDRVHRRRLGGLVRPTQ